MYEAFFGLQRRPFAATPDAMCWYAGGPYQAAIDELAICAEQGQGIAVLVSPAGSGKTVLCERLSLELGARFDTVLLRHATFQTRRALLQTLLSEMQQPFDKPTDQELRLGLAPVLRRLHQLGRALVLVVDEAHLLSESLLEELRILSDQAQDGKPLVRLVLIGQAGLEEKLVHPSMQALNHRLRAQVVLSTLTRQETADYLDYRVTWAGGRTGELFTPEAIDLICRAADGLPRCVNQLCDHALLRAYSEEQRPATVAHIAAALNDLKHLPLPWNSVPESIAATKSPSAELEWSTPATSETASSTIEFGDDATDDEIIDIVAPVIEPPTSTMPVYRLSAQLDEPVVDSDEMTLPTFASATPPMWQAKPQSVAVIAGPVAVTNGFIEEVVIDRYTALDAGLTPLEEMPSTPTPVLTVAVPTPPAVDEVIPRYSPQPLTWHGAMEQLTNAGDIPDRLDAVHDVLKSVTEQTLARVETRSAVSELGAVCPTGDRSAEDALGTTVLEICDDARDRAYEEAAGESAVFEFGGDTPATTHAEAALPAATEPRRYRHLFTLLRRKQQGRA
ncbi:MAG TPA: AAA family ATPase [Planctomycetaceae bacterium]|nr:AAA family ATPase [Planctomycetaceae bacterium]